MRLRGRPISSARAAESSADCTIASRITARASAGCGELGVLVHQVGEQLLVERAPVGADAHRLAVLDRRLDDGAELAVLLLLEADIAGIDAVLVERLGAGRMVGEQLVADVVEVADERHVDAHLSSRSLMCGTAAAASSRSTVMRTSSEPARASAATWRDGAVDVGRVGVGHRLHDDRRAAADDHAADIDRNRLVAAQCGPRIRSLNLAPWSLAPTACRQGSDEAVPEPSCRELPHALPELHAEYGCVNAPHGDGCQLNRPFNGPVHQNSPPPPARQPARRPEMGSPRMKCPTAPRTRASGR